MVDGPGRRADGRARQRRGATKPKKIAIIATKGTLDWAYPPLILATTAATLGWDAGIFFTFYGLKILQKDRKLEVGTTGNPAMPMPIPMPQLLTALPGMTPMATWMMKRQFKDHGVASIDELLEPGHRDGREAHPLRDDDGRLRLLEGRASSTGSIRSAARRISSTGRPTPTSRWPSERAPILA